MNYFQWLRNKIHSELARHLCEKYESVHPYLKNFADQHQPKTDMNLIDSAFPIKNDVKKQDDLMFNGFDDSLEDEKANQEAFERSQLLCGKQREHEQKISFLNSLNSGLADDDYSLIKTNVNRSPNSKIVIDNSFMKAGGKSDGNHEVREETKHKSVLGKYNLYFI